VALFLVVAMPPPAVGSLHPTGDEARQVSSPIAGSKGAKWTPGKGLEVASADKRFALTLYTLTQLQTIVRHTPAQPGVDGAADTPAHNDLQVVLRRARIVLSGNIFTPHIKYKIQLTASPVEMGFRDGVPHRSPILDWTYTFDRLRDFTIQIGQYKVPYNHERMLRISGLHLIDRSAANNEFTLDRDIGLDIRSKDVGGLGRLRYYAGIYLGDGIARFGPTDPGLMYTARVELLPFGLYEDLAQSDHERNRYAKMLVGAAYAYVDRDPNDTHGFNGAAPADGGKTNTHNATVDLNFRIAGFSIEGALFWRKGKRLPGDATDADGVPIPTVAPRNGQGYFVQAGYLLPRLPFEVGTRWGQIRPIGHPSQTSLRLLDELGGAVTYVFARESIKVQFDYTHLWNSDIRLGTGQARLQFQATF